MSCSPHPTKLLPFLCSLVSKTTGATAVSSQPNCTHPPFPALVRSSPGPLLILPLRLQQFTPPVGLSQPHVCRWPLCGWLPSPTCWNHIHPVVQPRDLNAISDCHTTWEPVREARGSAFKMQTHLFSRLRHPSQRQLTCPSPPCPSCHCSSPSPAGSCTPPLRPFARGSLGRTVGPQASCRCSSQHVPAPLHQHCFPEKAPFRCAGQSPGT